MLVLSTFFLGCIISILSLLGKPDFASRVFATRWAKFNSMTSLLNVEIKGADLIDPNTSYVIVANHQSLIDILILYGYLDLEIKWVMKQEIRAVPVLGIACELMGHIYIDRSNTNSALNSINKAKEKITDGMSVIFFPEGTRSRTGKLKRFKKGAFRFAQELQLEILPVAIHGSGKILPSDSINLTPGRATLEFCKPITTSGIEPREITKLSNQAFDSINHALHGAEPSAGKKPSAE